MSQCLFADVGNIASELFATKLCFANFHVKFINVNRRVNIFLHEAFRKNDRVFKVKTFKRHEGHQYVSSQGEFAFGGRSTVAKDFSLFDLLTDFYDRTLVQTGTLIQSGVFS